MALIITPSELGARSILLRGFYFREADFSLNPGIKGTGLGVSESKNNEKIEKLDFRVSKCF